MITGGSVPPRRTSEGPLAIGRPKGAAGGFSARRRQPGRFSLRDLRGGKGHGGESLLLLGLTLICCRVEVVLSGVEVSRELLNGDRKGHEGVLPSTVPERHRRGGCARKGHRPSGLTTGLLA